MPEEHDLDALVRRVDPDRWLAARFIDDPLKRADVLTLYAFNYELARAAEVTSQTMLGEIRLTWWREALAEIYRGRTIRRHPTVEALALAVERQGLAQPALEALIDGRSDALETGPPLNADRFHQELDATVGALMLLAARVLDAGSREDAVRGAGRAWGVAAVVRAQAAGSRRRLLPPGFDVPEALRTAMRDARLETRLLPVPAFPAVAYATLARAYASGRTPGPMETQARLLWAVTRGRL
jgi:phytoene synthase